MSNYVAGIAIHDGMILVATDSNLPGKILLPGGTNKSMSMEKPEDTLRRTFLEFAGLAALGFSEIYHDEGRFFYLIQKLSSEPDIGRTWIVRKLDERTFTTSWRKLEEIVPWLYWRNVDPLKYALNQLASTDKGFVETNARFIESFLGLVVR